MDNRRTPAYCKTACSTRAEIKFTSARRAVPAEGIVPPGAVGKGAARRGVAGEGVQRGK